MSIQTDAIIQGSKVRVIDPDRYVKTLSAKIRNRTGTAELIFRPMGASESKPETVRVVFEPRRSGGPTHVEFFPRTDLRLATEEELSK